jgi:hypothetical protein
MFGQKFKLTLEQGHFFSSLILLWSYRKEVQRNPNSMSPHITDPRMMQALGLLLLGVNIQTAFKIATWQ